ncbi:MAG: pyridoxal-phosphate dependent enzyme, partial [Oligoflexia bacterium]|nr:pyridoxal-phosphate dependent enzyme [Oligoflexia bacterium]
LKATIFIASFASQKKMEGCRALGADLHLFPERNEVEERCLQYIEQHSRSREILFIPPYDHKEVIAGQGTAAYEALLELKKSNALPPSAVIAPCGGGGLLSGTLLATKALYPEAKVIGVEPEVANDAIRSLQSGKIFRFETTPKTVADGARTLYVSERTFFYLKQLDHLFAASEEEIIDAMERLTKHLQMPIEPTSAMVLVAAQRLRASPAGPILMILSGGNI